MYEYCQVCRNIEETSILTRSTLYAKIQRAEHSPTFDYQKWLKMTIEAARLLGFGYIFSVSCETYNFRENNLRDQDSIHTIVEKSEGYKYVQNQNRHGNLFYICSQKQRAANSTREAADISKANKKRKHHSRRIFNCSGFLSMHQQHNGRITFRFGHRKVHESASILQMVSQSGMAKIRQLSLQSMAPFQICTAMRAIGRNLLWHQVHYEWAELQCNSSMKRAEPFESCIVYATTCSNIRITFISESPRALAFTTSIGEAVMKNHEGAEFFY